METRRRARVVLVLVTVALIAVMVGLLAPGAVAGHVAPSERSGNPSCREFGDWEELRVQPVTSGTYSDGTLTVTVTVSGDSFSWSANIGLDSVFVKGGPKGNLYSYSPEATSDSGLTAPMNDNGRPYGLSHISFCYDFERTQPTKSSSPPPSTPPPSTPPSILPTVLPTDIASPTEPGEIAPSVLPTRHLASPSDDGTPTPEDSVLPKRLEQPAVLPFTGGSLVSLLGVAFALIASGTALFVRMRKKP